jgi:hypothetical protein
VQFFAEKRKNSPSFEEIPPLRMMFFPYGRHIAPARPKIAPAKKGHLPANGKISATGT